MHEQLEFHFREIMEILGLDLTDDSLRDTPKRLAKLYGREVFRGLREDNFPKIMTIDNKFSLDEMILINDITVNSMCEHHFLPFFGECSVAYIPKDKIIGLSKINRLVEYYSTRPQVQERLTQDILNKMKELLETEDIAVSINATHTCVKIRGIKDKSSKTITTGLSGVFKKNSDARREFLMGVYNA